MERNCSTCGEAFALPPEELGLIRRMAFPLGSTVLHPAEPRQCPDCRTQIRTCHRNERFLSKLPSAFSGKDVVGIYHPEPIDGKPWKIFSQEEWRSDAWDPLAFGRPYDPSQSFFGQFAALQHDVPHMALVSLANENSGFTTGTAYCRNCYLINSSEYCEDCYYGKLYQRCKNSMDCSYLYDSELCHDVVSSSHCYGCQSVAFSQNCRDCFFSTNLKGCANCCLCTNLDHKEYHFMNQPLTKAEYEDRLAAFRGSFERTERMHRLRDDAMLRMPHKYANIVNGEGCTGDFIENSKQCTDCYDVTDSEDCRFVQVGVGAKDVQHSSNMYLNPELCYETLGTIETHTVAYCLYVFHSQRMLYCEYCFNCADCFGCSGLTRKQYCIFNTQYTKEEYGTLVPKIVERMKQTDEWGCFFPPSLSPFGYNETVANEYYPLSENEARAKGFHWRPKDVRDYRPQTCALPDRIDEVPDGIVQEILACAACRKNYRIIPQELAFCREQRIPVPRRCPDCRYLDRLRLRNPRRLYDRTCARCSAAVRSTYAPDRPETILCEACFLQSFS